MALRRFGTAIAAISGLLASTALGSPQGVIGFGHRSMGLGTTGTASAEGVDAVHANPGLLSAARETQLQLGLVGATFDWRVDGPGMPGQRTEAPLRATTIGLVLPLPFEGALRDRVALGLGFVTPTDVVVRARILYPERVQMPLADRVQSVTVQGGLGVELGHGVRVGAGVAALAALRGSVLVQTDASGRIGTIVEDRLVATYAPIVGASWEFAERRYRVGLAFRGALVGRFNVVIRAEDLGSIALPPLNISGVAQYDPPQLSLELARITGPWRVAAGVTASHGSAYPGPAEATVRCEDAGASASDCTAASPPSPGYRDTVAPRIGVERRIGLGRAVELSLRSGYAFEPSPAPEQTGLRNAFDMDRSVLSIGWGARAAAWPVSIDGFAQLQVLHEREHRKRIDAGAPVDGHVTASGGVFAAGFAVTGRL